MFLVSATEWLVPSVIQTRKREDVVAQRTNEKRSTTGGTRSPVGVLGRRNMFSHAGSAAEVAYTKFDERMVQLDLNATRVRGVP